jgi:uncharacterized protein YbjT (DUF2867 family)
MSATILVTGGSGRLGNIFSKLLTDHHIPHVNASRYPVAGDPNWTSMDLANGQGIREALQGKKIVVHLASGTKKYDENIDVNGTQRLLDAAKENGVEHLIYISIVGIDKVPVAYYQYKLQAEELIKNSGIPYTILRATQFHEFLDQMFQQFLFLPVAILPARARLQPVDTIIVAEELYRILMQAPANTTYDLGGPDVLELKKLYTDWKDAQQKWKWIIPLPAIGKTIRALNAGGLTCPERNAGGISWQQWLKKKYGGGTT